MKPSFHLLYLGQNQEAISTLEVCLNKLIDNSKITVANPFDYNVSLYDSSINLIINEDENDPQISILRTLKKKYSKIKTALIQTGIYDRDQVYDFELTLPLKESVLKKIVLNTLCEYDKLKNVFNEYLAQFLDIYLSENNETLERLNESFVNKDLSNVKIWAHKMKGAAGNTGVMDLYKICLQIEKMEALDNEMINKLQLEHNDITKRLLIVNQIEAKNRNLVLN